MTIEDLAIWYSVNLLKTHCRSDLFQRFGDLAFVFHF